MEEGLHDQGQLHKEEAPRAAGNDSGQSEGAVEADSTSKLPSQL